MSDKVQISVGTKCYQVQEYRIEADLYTADALFALSIPGKQDIPGGSRCQIRITPEGSSKDFIVLRGIADIIEHSWDAEGRMTKVRGRDLMGLLIDSCVETWDTYEDKTVKQLAETFIKPVPFINRSDIEYNDNAETSDHSGKTIQTSPGQTVFDVLRDAALARGLLFYSRPDAPFVFGRPRGRGQILHSLICKDGKNKSRILKGALTKNISHLYSKIMVVGQVQGFDTIDSAGINVLATKTDSTAPIQKTLVEAINDDKESPAKRARALIDQQRHRSRVAMYKVAGHSQNGNPWETDSLCKVDDDELDLHEDLLVIKRAFSGSKNEGQTTEILLAAPGVTG